MNDEALEARVNHPSWYTAHPSGLEAIELIEHLPLNLGNAVKYLWRCGLKSTETPLREFKSALWYTERELNRMDLYELHEDPSIKTDVVWRAHAHRVIESDFGSVLSEYLSALLVGDFAAMTNVLEEAVKDAAATPSRVDSNNQDAPGPPWSWSMSVEEREKAAARILQPNQKNELAEAQAAFEKEVATVRQVLGEEIARVTKERDYYIELFGLRDQHTQPVPITATEEHIAAASTPDV